MWYLVFFGLISAQNFERFVFPQPPVVINRDDPVSAVYPMASSGVSRTGHRYPTQMVEEVESMDLYPSTSEDQPPTFPVVSPAGAFGVRPLPAQPPPVQRPEPVVEAVEQIPEDYPEEYLPPQPPAPQVEKPDNAYEINFCDKREFPDDVLAQYGLERIDYFIWNTTCSDLFFQCSIGQTFVLRCSSADQAFDRAITNCNFRNANKVCPEYDHVMHCTIKESCSSMEYACCSMPQQCLPLSKRCDNHADCSDGDDENNCPSCARDEFACVLSGACISSEKRCDGVADDCGDGSNMDEIGCTKNSTCVGKFMCDQSRGEGPSCIEWTEHCDGEKHCHLGEDEINCRASETKYLLCENQKQSVTKHQWCDRQKDCADGSDEKYCY